jgi:hypothetical protein
LETLMLTEIRITDPYVIRLVEAEQKKTGEKTATKTAGRLLIERFAALREKKQQQQVQSATAG